MNDHFKKIKEKDNNLILTREMSSRHISLNLSRCAKCGQNMGLIFHSMVHILARRNFAGFNF